MSLITLIVLVALICIVLVVAQSLFPGSSLARMIVSIVGIVLALVLILRFMGMA